MALAQILTDGAAMEVHIEASVARAGSAARAAAAAIEGMAEAASTAVKRSRTSRAFLDGLAEPGAFTVPG
jgi:hypothetical protein